LCVFVRQKEFQPPRYRWAGERQCDKREECDKRRTRGVQGGRTWYEVCSRTSISPCLQGLLEADYHWPIVLYIKSSKSKRELSLEDDVTRRKSRPILASREHLLKVRWVLSLSSQRPSTSCTS
jgi:hypothetical protein